MPLLHTGVTTYALGLNLAGPANFTVSACTISVSAPWVGGEQRAEGRGQGTFT